MPSTLITSPSPKKIYLKTYGCQMNEHDSQRVLSHLKEINYFQTDNIKEADLILFNTCAIRDLANTKFYSTLGEVKKYIHNRKVIVGALGCVAQIEGKKLLKRYSYLNFILGTDLLDSINQVVQDAEKESTSIFKNSLLSNISFQTKIVHNSPKAFVVIMKGCNNFCSYCIVPYTRGREKSRKAEEIISDVNNLVTNKGIKEITLLGQNVNSFGKENNETMAYLIRELAKIDDLLKISYITSHPKDLSDELIDCHATVDKLSNHLHLAVQSGSNSVLKRMNRNYSVEHYLNLLRKLKQANQKLSISTDIICGFPNETASEHQETLSLLREAKFDSIFSFVFSPRPGTKAAQMEDEINLQVKKDRLREIQELQLSIQYEIRQKLIGQVFEVLVEGSSLKNKIFKWKGRTDCMRIIHFTSPEDLLGKYVNVKITSATALSCQGVRLDC